MAFLHKYVNNIKKMQDPLPKLSHEIKDLEISDSLKITLLGEEFLLFDNGVSSEEKMIRFSTQDNLEKLFDFNLWLAEGTFKHRPEGFQ